MTHRVSDLARTQSLRSLLARTTGHEGHTTTYPVDLSVDRPEGRPSVRILE